MTRAAIYCRLSEEDRNKSSSGADSASIQNQKAMLQQYAAQQNWEVVGIYSDDDYTGSDRNRPQFKLLLQHAHQRKFDIILCKTQSRFTRELELVEQYIHGLFPAWGIRFVSIVDNADTDNKGNKKSRQINGLVNEWYLEDMSENIRSVLTSRRKNGLHIGAFALYGYQKDPDHKGHLIVDEEAARIVREVFVLFSRGWGKTAIARSLNDRCIPPPAIYKQLRGQNYRNGTAVPRSLWHYASVSSMLTNELYIGNMVQGKYGSSSYKTKRNKPRPPSQWIRVEHTHEPIIDRALWDQVQSLLQARTKPFSSGTVGLFSGKVFCAGCGGTMRSVKSHGRYYLTCPTRRISKEACPGAFISVQQLEIQVLEALNAFTEQYLDLEKLKQSLTSLTPVSDNVTALRKKVNAYRRKIDACSQSMKLLYLDRVRGLVGEEDYAQMLKAFSSEKAQCMRQLTFLQAQLDCFPTTHSPAELNAMVLAHVHPPQLSREMVLTFIKRIVVSKKIIRENTVPVEIHWNF